MQYKRNVIEGTVDRVFRCTSTWEDFDQALEKNRKQWIENQNPKNWSWSQNLDMVVFETLNKIIEGKKNFEVKQTIFTTRKLKTCLPSLKTSFARELRSKVVYKLTCRGCNSTYVGQTVRNLATMVNEHSKGDSPAGQH